MKKFFMIAAIFASVAGLSVNAQNQKSIKDYSEVAFYGIDFGLVKTVGATESETEFLTAFKGINELILSEQEKYVNYLADRLKKTIQYIDIEPVLNNIQNIDVDDMKVNHTAKPLTMEDVAIELQELDIKPADQELGLVVMAGELNKGTDYGTFYYVFFNTKTLEVLDCKPFKGQSGGMGLRNYWARAFYRTIGEVNPSKFYQAKKKIKEGVTEGYQAVKEKVTGTAE